MSKDMEMWQDRQDWKAVERLIKKLGWKDFVRKLIDNHCPRTIAVFIGTAEVGTKTRRVSSKKKN